MPGHNNEDLAPLLVAQAAEGLGEGVAHSFNNIVYVWVFPPHDFHSAIGIIHIYIYNIDRH